MTRLLCSLPLAFASLSAFAQAAEPPVEHASPLAVGIFVLLFVVACVGFIGYTWWSGKKRKERGGR